MKTTSILSKSLSYLLLIVVFHMHVCSALCASGYYGCCSNNNISLHCCKSCCGIEKQGNESGGCQKIHCSFFNIAGQFSSDKNHAELNGQQIILFAHAARIAISPIEQNRNIFVYNGFHPPPPKKDIRTTISSFLI